MKKELTPFGEAFEKLRFERKQTLEEAARALVISPAYLSAIIHGKRDIPFDFIDKMEIAYGLTEEQSNHFEELVDKTPRIRQITKDEVRAALINMVNNVAESEEQVDRMIKKINEFLDNINKK